MKRSITRKLLIFALITAMILCAGCRKRVPESASSVPGVSSGEEGRDTRPGGGIGEQAPEDDEATEAEPDPNAETIENPESERREYDENAAVELVDGTDRYVHGEGEGEGAYAENEDSDTTVSKLSEDAEETATMTVPAEESENLGVSQDADEADSAMTYYTVLLSDRLGTLYECKRINAYLETSADHVTVFKKSEEHALIISSGAYDVSSRLLEENLLVDEGWIERKNPDMIVKFVSGSVLGHGVDSASEAEDAYLALIARTGIMNTAAAKTGKVLLMSEELMEAPYMRTAAALIIAKTAYPDLFEDTDVDEAVSALTEEATGASPAGIYYYHGN